MREHIKDYQVDDLVDMQDFIDYFDLTRDFLITIDHIGRADENDQLDNIINKLQKLRNRKHKPYCLINTDNLIDALIEEDGDAREKFEDEISSYECGEMPSAYDDYYDYVCREMKELGRRFNG